MIGPSTKFLEKVAHQPQMMKLIERVKKEFDIYSYLTDIVPTHLSDSDWAKLTRIDTIEDRVRLLKFIAVREQREKLDIKRREKIDEKIRNFYEVQNDLFERGGMGYGSGLYQTLLNPFALLSEETERVFDSRQCIWHRLKDRPRIALDFQFFSTSRLTERSRLCKNLRYFLSHNRRGMHNPFPLSFINVADDGHTNEYFESIGMVNRNNKKGNFLPEIHSDNPFWNERRSKKIVYICKYAKDMLDGPLVHDTYILPMTFDNKRESLYAARRDGFQMMSLPIDKYVKWKSGSKFLPLTNIQMVFETVSRTGGDWERALRENISMRHLISHDENRENDKVHKKIQAYRVHEQNQIVAAIQETLGKAT